MKTGMIAAAALALMSMSALAEEAATEAQTPAASAPVEQVALPQSTATDSVPLAVSEPETASGGSYGGCSHRKSTVYLTN